MHHTAFAYGAAGGRALDRRRERSGDHVVKIADIGRDIQLPLFVHQQHIQLIAAEEVLAAHQNLVEHRPGVSN